MMSRNRLLYTAERVALMIRRAERVVVMVRDRALAIELEAKLQNLRREFDELREVMQLVVSVTRQQTEDNLADLRHQLELALARLERPQAPLH
jgi:hypothetical protein